MGSKTCFKCGRRLPLESFYAHPGMADGRLNKCKDCARADVKSTRMARHDYYIAFDRARNKDPKRKAAHNERARARNQDPECRRIKNERARLWQRIPEVRAKLREKLRNFRKQHPEKDRAHWLVGDAIAKGLIVKQPCEKCGTRAQAHHGDYAKPLEVQWLCSQHHRDEHRRLKELGIELLGG